MDRVKELVRYFDDQGKPIAAICHGPQILISAGIMKGRTATSYSSVQAELKEAGVETRDEEVVVDGNLITSRQPGDIPAFNQAMLERL
jgi:protease I